MILKMSQKRRMKSSVWTRSSLIPVKIPTKSKWPIWKKMTGSHGHRTGLPAPMDQSSSSGRSLSSHDHHALFLGRDFPISGDSKEAIVPKLPFLQIFSWGFLPQVRRILWREPSIGFRLKPLSSQILLIKSIVV